jgi:Fe-S oxidoreductase
VKWFRRHEPSTAAGAGPDTDRRAVLFADLYTNYMLPERGKAAVRTLESLGVEVEVPPMPGAGRPPLSQGMIATASEQADRVSRALDPYLEDGYDVVVVEPSDLAMFREDYEELLPTDAYDRLAGNSYELFEYLYGVLEDGADAEVLRTAPSGGESVAYHSHCQQRTMGLEEYTLAVLAERGYDVTTSDAECCGMAGSFGYKEQYYDLSMDVGETLGDQLREADAVHVVASGTSCTDQIDDLLGDEPRHPIELIAPAE